MGLYLYALRPFGFCLILRLKAGDYDSLGLMELFCFTEKGNSFLCIFLRLFCSIPHLPIHHVVVCCSLKIVIFLHCETEFCVHYLNVFLSKYLCAYKYIYLNSHLFPFVSHYYIQMIIPDLS